MNKLEHKTWVWKRYHILSNKYYKSKIKYKNIYDSSILNIKNKLYIIGGYNQNNNEYVSSYDIIDLNYLLNYEKE